MGVLTPRLLLFPAIPGGGAPLMRCLSPSGRSCRSRCSGECWLSGRPGAELVWLRPFCGCVGI